MKYILYALMIFPIQVFCWSWNFKWISYERIKSKLNETTPSYVIGGLHFTIILIVILAMTGSL